MDNRIIVLLVTTAWCYFFTLFPLAISISVVYFMIYSSYWWMILPYIIWIWKDRKTPERGGRVIERVRGWSGWKYLLKYFKYQLIKEEGCELDMRRNYLFCCFPHGIIPFGIICTLIDSVNNKRRLPFGRLLLCTLNVQFFIPFNRDLLLSCGLVSSSEKSLKYNLTASEGGNIVCLVVGGASEVYYCKPNMYKLVLRNRRGFIRIALETGSPLVPVITFNETSIFDQFDSPVFKTIQECLRKCFHYPPVLFKGDYLIFPKQVPITVLVGKPIEVKKNPSPTKEEIEELHQLFIAKLTEMFETNKHKYIRNASNVFLEIV